MARPASCKLGNISNSMSLYRDIEQYPDATGIPGMLLLQLGSPIYFANCSYLRDRSTICIFLFLHSSCYNTKELFSDTSMLKNLYL